MHRNALVREKGVEEGAEQPGKVGGPVLGIREVRDVKLGAEPKVVKPYNQVEGG